MTYAGDVHTIRTFDGEQLTFPDEEHRFLAYIGYGAPPLEYQTQRGYKQHGETVLDYLLGPRSVTIDLWQKPACDRATYWRNRAALHELLRPNRGGPLELTLAIPDGTKRSILLYVDPGAKFDTPQTDDNNWEINETLDAIAFDPIWYNSSQTVQAVAADSSQNLIFPITFPIMFGPGGVVYTSTITYTGSWRSYPTLIITGPYTSVTITNETTGAVIRLIIPIVAGQSRTIDLTPGQLSIVDQDGVSQFGDLSSDSDLVDFAIEPTPTAPGGVNTIVAQIVDATPASAFTIEYSERYYAI